KKNLKIMFPMISSVREVVKAKKILNEVKEDLRKQGIGFDKKIEIGIMIEVPSAYFLADELAKEVDFFSIGTNDLIQYLLAVDRGNEYISNLYQQFHPAVLKVIKKVTEAAHANKIRISVCGEMASDPLATPVLIGLGIDELSVVPSMFPEIKQIIRKVNYKDAKKFCEEILTLGTEEKIRSKIEKYYKEKINISL
ncbi:MAG: putative PEP-binding protein, partial [Ignavibacteria bacterium]